MPATASRIVWPEKSLAQLMGAKPVSTNGNGKHPETKSLPTISYPAELFFGLTDNLPGGEEKLAGFSAYALSTLAYACIRYRSTKIVEAPLWIVEETPDGDEWVAGDHPLAQVLEEPNPDMEMADLLECVSTYLDVTGRALLVKNRDRAGRVAQLYPFSGYDFSVYQAQDRIYGNYVVRTQGGERFYKPEDVVFFRNLDPRFHGIGAAIGLSPLDVALGHVNIAHEMRRAVQAALRNQIRPGAIFEFPTILENEVYERQKAEISANYGGVQNTGRSMMLEGGAKSNILTQNLKDLELGPIEQDVEAAICSCFQVHPAVVGAKIGIIGNRGLADTIKPAAKLFYDLFAFPTWARLEKTLTRSLLREVDDNPLRRIAFDKSKVRELQDDVGERTKEATDASGYWTVNEQRLHTGQEALPPTDPRGEEIGKAPVAAVTDPISSPQLAIVKRRTPVRIETKRDMRTRLWAKFDIKATREESKYEAEAKAQFEKEKAEVDNAIAGVTRAGLGNLLARLARDYAHSESKYRAEWADRYRKLVETTFDVAGNDIAAELGFQFDLSNPQVQGTISRRVNKLAGEVTQTTYDKLKDVISESRANGEGTAQLSERIRNDVFGGEITKARARTIARTETAGALNSAEMVAARESGIVVQKEWLSQGDERVRDSHAAIDGQRVGLGEPFGNGLQQPGDQNGPPEEVISCRCSLLFHTDEAA